ncbi:hypothetical protein LZ32DRAFT_327383 [Colletotrichum eremochloae]|nr:hypothetical protein LZ32DRAFT_327383 [Colletotrichum eremochloae]
MISNKKLGVLGRKYGVFSGLVWMKTSPPRPRTACGLRPQRRRGSQHGRRHAAAKNRPFPCVLPAGSGWGRGGAGLHENAKERHCPDNCAATRHRHVFHRECSLRTSLASVACVKSWSERADDDVTAKPRLRRRERLGSAGGVAELDRFGLGVVPAETQTRRLSCGRPRHVTLKTRPSPGTRRAR